MFITIAFLGSIYSVHYFSTLENAEEFLQRFTKENPEWSIMPIARELIA